MCALPISDAFVLIGYSHLGKKRMTNPIEHRGPEGANFWRRARWIAIAAILVLPFLAMQWTDEVTWTAADFAVAGILLVGANILYRSEEHTSELQSLMRISYSVFCLKKTNDR